MLDGAVGLAHRQRRGESHRRVRGVVRRIYFLNSKRQRCQRGRMTQKLWLLRVAANIPTRGWSMARPPIGNLTRFSLLAALNKVQLQTADGHTPKNIQ